MSTTLEINTIYNNLTYNDFAGTDVTISCLLIIVLLTIITYFYIKINLKSIQKKWKQERCNPFYMPFAGWIAAPKNTSWWKYTETNFNFCLGQILKDVFEAATYAIDLTEKAILDIEKAIIEAINELIALLDYIEKLLMQLINSLLKKIENIFVESTKIAYSMKDIFDRNHSIFTIIIYTIETIWNTIGSISDLIWLVIVDFFTCIFSLAIKLFELAFKFLMFEEFIFVIVFMILALTGGIAIIVIFTVLGLLVSWLGPINELIFHNSPARFPRFYDGPVSKAKNIYNKVKHIFCFHKLTPIPLNNKHLPIYKVEPGMQLMNGQTITTTLVLDSKKEIMYKLDNTIVSGSHPVYHNYAWILVKDHPDAIKLDKQNEPIYCLNTLNKVLKLNTTIFSDWDDIEANDLLIINKHLSHNMSIKKLEDIYSTLESGLHPDTPIELDTGMSVPLHKIQLNNRLKGGIIVTGVVKSINKNLLLYSHKINNIECIGTHNISYIKDDTIHCQLQKPLISTADLSTRLYSGKYLHHIITDKGYFYLNDTMIKDYYYGMEQFFI